jgi:hypothetical protein
MNKEKLQEATVLLHGYFKEDRGILWLQEGLERLIEAIERRN